MNRSNLFLLCLLSVAPLPGQGAMLNLPQLPINLITPTPPNIMFEFDDSGSMDWEGCAYA